MTTHQFLWGMTHKQATVCCGVARSTIIRTMRAVPSVTGTIQTTGTTISVFGFVCAQASCAFIRNINWLERLIGRDEAWRGPILAASALTRC